MTRREFIDEITRFYELRDFCNENDIYTCDEYFDSDDLDDEVDNDMRDCDYGWRDLRDSLNSIETGYDFYKREGYLYYEGCTDEDFENLKEDVLEVMDERGAWDYDEDDEYEDDEDTDDDEYVYKDPEDVEPETPIQFDEFVGLQVIPLKQA